MRGIFFGTHRLLRHIPSLAGLLLFSASSSFPITISDTGNPGYATGTSAYTGVVEILFNHVGETGTFLCSGSLMATGVDILTAGHCIDNSLNWTVTFETAGGTTTLQVSQALLHPLYDARPAPVAQLHQYDVGLLRLAAPAPEDAQRYGLKSDYSGIEFENTLVDLVGYGVGGQPGGPVLEARTRRHARNWLDFVIGAFSDGTHLASAPDHPFEMMMDFGAPDGPYQGLINSGDSGGPALFGNDVIGVASFGNLPTSGSYPDYGWYSTGHASLADPVTGDWVESMLTPEPTTLLLLGVGLILLRYLKSYRTGGFIPFHRR